MYGGKGARVDAWRHQRGKFVTQKKCIVRGEGEKARGGSKIKTKAIVGTFLYKDKDRENWQAMI